MFNYVARVLTRTCCFYTYHITRTSCFYISDGINQTLIRASSRFQEDIKIPHPHGTISHTVIRVSDRVSKKISKFPGPMEQLTVQSWGFLIGFQEDIKIMNHHRRRRHHHHHHQPHHHPHHHYPHHPHHNHHHRRHFGLPGHSLRVRANLRALP